MCKKTNIFEYKYVLYRRKIKIKQKKIAYSVAILGSRRLSNRKIKMQKRSIEYENAVFALGAKILIRILKIAQCSYDY